MAESKILVYTFAGHTRSVHQRCNGFGNPILIPSTIVFGDIYILFPERGRYYEVHIWILDSVAPDVLKRCGPKMCYQKLREHVSSASLETINTRTYIQEYKYWPDVLESMQRFSRGKQIDEFPLDLGEVVSILSGFLEKPDTIPPENLGFVKDIIKYWNESKEESKS